MLKRYDCELENVPYTSSNNVKVVMEQCKSGEYVKYSDIDAIIELNKKLLGKNAYTPKDIQTGIDSDEIENILTLLEKEISKIED